MTRRVRLALACTLLAVLTSCFTSRLGLRNETNKPLDREIFNNVLQTRGYRKATWLVDQ